MSDLSGSQLLFYGGIAVMILAAMLAGLCAVFLPFRVRGLGKGWNRSTGNRCPELSEGLRTSSNNEGVIPIVKRGTIHVTDHCGCL